MIYYYSFECIEMISEKCIFLVVSVLNYCELLNYFIIFKTTKPTIVLTMCEV